MTLAETLFYMMQQNQGAMQLTDLVTGTVTSADPLEITVSNTMAPLRKEILYLTEPVVEKKIPVLQHLHTISVLSHSHSAPGGGTSTNLTDSYDTSEELKEEEIIAVEHGQPLPVRDGYIILNRGLEEGDKVLLLRVQHGQRFIVLSRVFE